MGTFDDLIPQTAAPAPPSAASRAGTFDDLIPQAQKAQTAQPAPAAPAASGVFDDLVPATSRPTGQPAAAQPASQPPGDWRQAVSRGYATTKGGFSVLGSEVGLTSEAELAASMAEMQLQLEANRGSPQFQETMKRFASEPQYQGWGGRARFVMENPGAVGTILMEQIPGQALSLGAGLAGTAAGIPAGPVGMRTGMALGGGIMSFAREYGPFIMEQAAENGIELKSEADWKNLFANKELMSKIRAKAAAKSGTVGAFDAISGFIGASGFGRVAIDSMEAALGKQAAEAAAQVGLGRLAAESAVNVGQGAAFGGAGEALGTVLAGEQIEPFDVYAEILGEVAFGAPGAALEVGIDRLSGAGGNVPGPSVDDIRRAAASLARPAMSFEEATAGGRNWYGFVDPTDPGIVAGGAPLVSRNYESAEIEMGSGDARRGRLVAASLDDVTEPESIVAKRLKAGEDVQAVVPTDRPEVAQLWEDYKAGTVGAAAYYQAAKEGLRVAPTGNNAAFVGDSQTAEITPKLEAPAALGALALEIRSATGAFVPAPSPIDHANLFTLLKDNRFTVMPDRHAVERLAKNPRLDSLAPSILKPKDAVTAERVKAEGWSAVLSDLAKQGAVFHQDPKAFPFEVLPNIPGWKSDISALRVYTELSEAEASTVLKAEHSVLAPRVLKDKLAGVARADQLLKYAGLDVMSAPIAGVPKLAAGHLEPHISANIPAEQLQAVEAFLLVARRLLKGLGFKFGVHMMITGPNESPARVAGFGFQASGMTEKMSAQTAGWAWSLPNGDFMMAANGTLDVASLHRVLMHEFGHLIGYDALNRQPAEVQALIYAAYRRFLFAGESRASGPVGFLHRRATAYPMSSVDYQSTFTEWFAEQVARWGRTSRHPMTTVGKFFKSLGRKIIASVREFRRQYTGESLKAEQIIQDWLDASYKDIQATWADSVVAQMQARTAEVNGKWGVDSPLQPESVKTHAVLDRWAGPNGTVGGRPVGKTKAYVDWQWKIFKWFLQFRQMAQAYPHIQPLNLYAEFIEKMQNDTNKVMVSAETIVRAAKKLRWQKAKGSRSQSEALGGFMFDLSEMVYRKPIEVQQGVRRWPNSAELSGLIDKWGLNQDALAVYEQVKREFRQVVERMEELSGNEAMATITDPQQLQIALGQARMMSQHLLAAPYFPQTRLGEWAVTIRRKGPKGQQILEHFETFDTKRQQTKAMAEAKKQWPGHVVTASTMPEEVKHYVGMPPWVLDKLGKMPGQSPMQREWLELLRYEMAPAQSWRKHLLRKRGYPGYSRDWERVFARYMFHHARTYGRMKYERNLEGQIKAVRSPAYNQPGDQNLANRLGDFLEDHFKAVVNPAPDWAMFRSVTAIWYLGFSPASAALNLTQSVVVTTPYLAQHFGDVSAMAAMLRASRDMTTYYKRGTYEGQTDLELRMLDILIKQNIVTESQAAQLAGLASGGSLAGLGAPTALQRGWLAFSEKAMWLFQTVEQVNRRVSARAAFRLAMDKPETPWLQTLKNQHYLQFQELQAVERMTEREALAVLAAKTTLLDTHYDYSKVARPRMMRGRKGILLAFYMFTQNTVFQLMRPENRGMLLRYALLMAFIAGPMGLMPDDAEDVLNFIGRRAFGGDFDIERQAYQLVNQLMEEDSPLPPDLLLHGVGRYSMGIPALLDMVGVNWYPALDRSKAVALQQIAPLPVTGLLKGGSNWERTMSEAVENLAGAGFGIGFGLWKAATNNELEWGDMKRWEAAMPRAMSSVSKAARFYREGYERSGKSLKIAEFDKEDPADLAEIIGRAMGYNPTKLSQAWDRMAAAREIDNFWKAQKALLMHRAFKSKMMDGNDEEFRRVVAEIRDFNKRIPDKHYAITPARLKQSFRTKAERQGQYSETGQLSDIPPGVNRQVGDIYGQPAVAEIARQRVR